MEPVTSRQFTYQNPLALGILATVELATLILFTATDVWATDLWLAILTMVVLTAILFMTVTITVDTDVVRVRLAGVVSTEIPLTDVTSAEIREYRPLKQFGGWGWRFGRDGDRAYTTRGTTAVVLRRVGGSEVYLGVEDEQAILDAIRARAAV